MCPAHAEYITKNTYIHQVFICQVKIKHFESTTISKNKMCPTYTSLIRGLPDKLNLPCTNPINIKQTLGANLHRTC